jgi:hypothetical protein
VTSNVAALVVAIPNPARLVNLSILSTVTPAAPMFTVGVVIGGGAPSATKSVLVRAVGPSLASFGVGSPLADLSIGLFSGETLIESNDNWGGSVALGNAFANVGAFAYASTTSRDAALLNSALPAGGYTVQVSGVAGATGPVLAEIYEATPGSAFTVTTPRLVNVSVLKHLGAGEILTAGFVVGGAPSKQLLIRAVGPTLGLAPFNVAGVMADPKLELFNGPALVQSNDDWGGSGALTAAFANVGAFALAAGSKDAAILVTLSPGNYTAQVSGANGAAGLTLVEVYEVP